MGTGMQTGMRTGTSTGGRSPANIVVKLQEFFQSLSAKQKLIGLGMIVLLIGMTLVINLAIKSTAYVPLYSSQALSMKDAQAVSMELDKMGISYQLSEESKQILVAPKIKAKVVMKLAYLGYPRRQRPTDDDKKSGGFTPESPEKLKKEQQVALEWDIIEAIRTMDGVADAYVKLVVPEKSYFSEDGNVSKAAVILSLQPDTRLSQSQINAIANLVSHAVPRLEKENVSITDTDGNIYVATEDNSPQETAKSNDERVISFEKRLKGKIEQALNPVLGDNNYTVDLTVAMDFSQVKTTEIKHGGPLTKDGKVISSATTNVERLSNVPKGKETDVEQISSNVKKLMQGKEGVDYEKLDKTVKYNVDEIKRSIVDTDGRIDRISVGLAVNNLNEEQIAALKQFVQGVVGYSAGRGDTVTVNSMPFSKPVIDDIAKNFKSAPPIPARRTTAVSNQLILTMALMPMALIFIVLAFFLIKQRKVTVDKTRIFAGAPGAAALGTITDLTSDKVGKSTLTPSQETAVNISAKLESLAKEKPTKVAELLKSTWLADKEE